MFASVKTESVAYTHGGSLVGYRTSLRIHSGVPVAVGLVKRGNALWGEHKEEGVREGLAGPSTALTIGRNLLSQPVVMVNVAG